LQRYASPGALFTQTLQGGIRRVNSLPETSSTLSLCNVLGYVLCRTTYTSAEHSRVRFRGLPLADSATLVQCKESSKLAVLSERRKYAVVTSYRQFRPSKASTTCMMHEQHAAPCCHVWTLIHGCAGGDNSTSQVATHCDRIHELMRYQ
jgi:hypothetical protein